MMKYRNPKIQNILMKGIAITLTAMFTFTPLAYAATSLDDNSLESSFVDKLLYGTVGSIAKEMEEYFSEAGKRLYIKNEDGLRALAEYVNSGHEATATCKGDHSCEGQRIYLANDIEVNSNEEWVPIGNSSNRFKGTFDGLGHTISGIYFSKENKSINELTNIGLFGYNEGTIKNITLANTIIDISYSMEDINNYYDKNSTSADYSHAGGIAGLNNEGTIENCTVESNALVSATTYVGGIVGMNSKGMIKNCTNKALVNGLDSVGGIVGYNWGDHDKTHISSGLVDFSEEKIAKIINCTNTGKVNALFTAVGGIAGSQRFTAVIQKCENTGPVSISTELVKIAGQTNFTEPENAGGIVGWITGGTKDTTAYYTIIDGCINDGSVVGYRDIGGIAGQLGGTNGGNVIMRNCINYTTDIKATMPIESRAIINEDYQAEEGFLAGEIGPVQEVDGKEVEGTAYLYNNMYYLTNELINEASYSGVEYGYSKATRGFPSNAAEITKQALILDVWKPTEQANFAGRNNMTFTIRDKETIAILGYGNSNNYTEYMHTTTIITDINNKKTMILPNELDGDTYSEKPMQTYEFRTSYLNYGPILTEETSTNTTATIGTNVNVKVDNSSYLYTKGSGEFKISNNNSNRLSQTLNTSDTSRKVNVDYTIYKNGNEINGDTYFIEGDTIKVTAKFDKYLASSYGPLTKIATAPTLRLNNSITMNAGPVNVTTAGYTTTIEYTYTVKDGDNIEITSLNLIMPGTVYTVGSDYATLHPTISTTSASTPINGITFDTTAPIVTTKVYVENKLEAGRYTAGKEVLIEVTTSEPIQDNYITPAIQVSFSKSGIGKYNYTKEPETVGYAKCKDARINGDGTTTWLYSYQIQEGDEGNIQLNYTKDSVTDLAGNVSDLTIYSSQYVEENTTGDTSSSKKDSIIGTNVASQSSETKEITYNFYKGTGNSKTPINDTTYIKKEDILTIEAEIQGFVYTSYANGTSGNSATLLTSATAPELFVDGKKAQVSSVRHNQTISSNVTQQNYDDVVTTITYTISGSSFDYSNITKLSSMKLQPKQEIYISNRYVKSFAADGASTDELYDVGQFNTVTTKIGTTNSSTVDISDLNIYVDPIGIAETFDVDDIYADTTAPTVDIWNVTTAGNNISNKEYYSIRLKWSEDVVGFTKEDITVKNGTIEGDLVKAASDNLAYFINVKTDVKNGNVGEMEIIVEQDAVKDLVGLGNIRSSKTIIVDRKAPILISLEAYANANVALGDDINDVKEYYKVDDTVTIVATFDENIENSEVPTLALQFSESGNAKGDTPKGKIEGNKITYTYTIAEGDSGTLSVKGFSGTVVDVAGNETKVTKRALDGDTIIADSEAPKVVSIKAIAPDFEYDELLTNPGDTKRYGIGTEVKFIVEFDKNIYRLNRNAAEKITKQTAPVLQLSFGNGTRRNAIFDSVEGKTLKYTYTIVGKSENDNGDNGELSVSWLAPSSDGTVVIDIAGNSMGPYQIEEVEKYESGVAEENKVDNITADTTKPSIGLSVTAVDKDDNGNTITGNGNDYRKGSIITITASIDEYVYKNNNKDLQKFTQATAPALNISFSESGIGTRNCTNVEYVNNQTVFTYEYIIKENDTGTLSVAIAENSMYDIALNGNDEKNQDWTGISADTERPYYPDQPGIEYSNGTYTVTFNEDLYYLENNRVKSFGDLAKAPKLKFEGSDVEYTATKVEGNVITYNTGSYINAKPYLSNSTLCDKAGNLYAYYDQQAPILSNNRLIVTSPETGVYKAGEIVTIVATYSENITGTAPALALQFSESGSANRTVSAGIIEGNTITYTYEITKGDNGVLSLASYTGGVLKDSSDNVCVLPENITLGGNTITADTKAPTVKITSNVTRINQGKVTYTFTWDEPVEGFTEDDIEVTNGVKGTFTKVNEQTYTLEVVTTNEGRQIVNVGANVCTDKAGNPNEQRATYNEVVVDFTKPTVRARINGGTYVIDTDNKTSKLNEKLVINEELSKFEYIWSTSTTTPTSGWETISTSNIEINSDIPLTTSVNTTGTYYLYMRVTDLAGNIYTGRTKAFEVKDSKITFEPSTTTTTNKDVTVTVKYGDALTENRKAGVQGKTQSADATTVIVSENGTVYAEATDIAGNKVYNTLKITNINKTQPSEPDPETPPVEDDETAPEITFNYTTTTATVGTTIGATITSNEDAVIEYSWDNQNWTSSSDYVRSVNARRTPTTPGTYTLYARATDKAGNVSDIKELEFTVYESENDIVNPEIEFEDLTTIQKDGVKYVKVSPTYTVEQLTAKMDVDALAGKTPEYRSLTSSNGLKTGTEITIDGNLKYIVIVNGDVNCDGKVTFLGDIILINNYRIGVVTNLSDIQILAGDINNTGTIEFIPDIVAMNNYRLGRITVL